MKTYKVISFFCILLFFFSCKKEKVVPIPSEANNIIVETKPAALIAVKQKVNAVIGGFYSGMPDLYDITTKKYPLIVFIHGAGQFGDGSTNINLLLNDAIPKLLAQKTFPPNFKISDENLSFIVLVPQFSKSPLVTEVKEFVDFARSKYRIDSSRIYMAGLSMGGVASSDYAAAYPSELAAIVTMSGATTNTVDAKAKTIVDNKIGVWSFHNQTDPVFNPQYSIDFNAALNKYQPLVPVKLTIFPVLNQHDSWTQACKPSYKEDNKNIYEWMLGFKK